MLPQNSHMLSRNILGAKTEGFLSGLNIPYSAKFWRDKTLANRSFQTFWRGKRWRINNNIISYFSESGIWLGKILANDVQFAKFAKVFPRQNFALYGILFLNTYKKQ